MVARVTALTNVTWTDVVGCSTNGSSLTRTDPTYGWNAGAASVQTLSGNGYVEFTTAETPTYMMAGLVHTYEGPSYQTIDFAIYLTGDGYVVIYEDGTYVAVFGTYAVDDLFQVVVTGTQVTYLQNSNLLYTSHKTPTLPLLFAAALFEPGATANNVAFYVAPGVATALPVLPPVATPDLAVAATGAGQVLQQFQISLFFKGFSQATLTGSKSWKPAFGRSLTRAASPR